MLREAREKAGLSVTDLATRLRMGARQIEALETGDYAALPTGTFLRGFVRNYAKAVAVDPSEAIARLEESHQAAAKSPTIVVPSQNIRIVPAGSELATPKARLFIALGVLVVLVGAVWYWWEYIRPHLGETDMPAKDEQKATVAVEAPAVTVAPPAALSANADEATRAAVPVTLQPPDPAAKQAGASAGDSKPAVSSSLTDAHPASATSVPAVLAISDGKSNKTASPTAIGDVAKPAAQVRTPSNVEANVSVKTPVPGDTKAAVRPVGSGVLGFTFADESWVEVRDATGKLLVSRRYRAGEAEEAVGVAPFTVVIGNAKATRMAFNGREFDLAPHTRVSVARVTVK
jgi:cytoskeleton protein RodZ